MKQLILHIGMHKTGTTSIQRSLDGLAESRVKYLALGSANHSAPMGLAFSDREPRGRRARPERSPQDTLALKQRIREQLEAELSSKKFDKFVISGEGMVFLSIHALRDLRALLMKHVDDVRVFAYVRDPVGFSGSALQQRIKGGYAGYELTRANYEQKFAPFISVFGRDHFSVKEFSRPALRDGSVVSDFCHLWGIPHDPRREVRSNESLAEPTVKLLHLFNRSGVASLENRLQKQARMLMVEAMGKHFKGKFDLPMWFRAEAIDPQDIEWLKEQCGIALAVDPAATVPAPGGEFKRYLDDIPPEVVESYRELLAQSGIHVSAADSTVEMLNKHFAACLSQAPEAPPRARPAGRRRGAAGLIGLRL